jgi:Rad3-related DNA helicase
MNNRILEAKNRFEKFRNLPFREHQAEIVEFACRSKKKFTVIEAPTGIGKTLAGMCIGSMYGGAIYTVHSKTLQKQIGEDFKEVPVLWGRNNYACLYDDKLTTDMCPLSKDKCENYWACLYNVAKLKASKSNLCTLNYHYLLTEVNFVGVFSGRNLIIIDEADSLETVLADFIGININNRMVKDYKIPFPSYKTTSSPKSIDSWIEWAETLLDSLGTHMRRIKMSVDTTGDIVSEEQYEAIKKIKQIETNMTKLNMFIDNVDSSWLYEERESKYGVSIHFNPTWISVDLAYKYLWNHADKFVLMSATFPYLPVLTKLLGMEPGDVDYSQYPSIFPVENRQVKYEIAGDLVYAKMKEETPKVIKKVKEIINRPENVNEKGLIHTVSYRLADEIMKIGDKRLVTHTNDSDRSSILDRFMFAREPLILVSPSMERGISLDDDLCRFVIFLKAPFLSLADKLVNARLFGSQIGQIWFISQMLLSVVQGCGRAVRSNKDYAKAYILDYQIQKAISRNPNMVPKWFRDSVWILLLCVMGVS